MKDKLADYHESGDVYSLVTLIMCKTALWCKNDVLKQVIAFTERLSDLSVTNAPRKSNQSKQTLRAIILLDVWETSFTKM